MFYIFKQTNHLELFLMYKKNTLFFFLSLLFSISAVSQNGKIKGTIVNATTNEPVEFAGIQVQGTTLGTTSQENGVFELTNVKSGFVRLVVSFIGFETTVSSEIQVMGNQTSFINKIGRAHV